MNKFEESSDLIVTAEQGIAVAKLLGEHKIVLLRNHGIVVAGTSIEETCIRGVLLEHSAKTQVAAASMGAFSWATDADALLKRKRIYRPDAMINLVGILPSHVAEARSEVTVQAAADSLSSSRSNGSKSFGSRTI